MLYSHLNNTKVVKAAFVKCIYEINNKFTTKNLADLSVNEFIHNR